MEMQSNKVIGIIGTPKSVDRYIATNFLNINMDYFTIDMKRVVSETQ